jgi:hypothetical protein
MPASIVLEYGRLDYWLGEPSVVIGEMLRLSRRGVSCSSPSSFKQAFDVRHSKTRCSSLYSVLN